MDYQAGIVPQEPANLPAFLLAELQRLQEVLSGQQSFMWLRELHVEPKKPRNGMAVYADGTDWNPGSGRGLYHRRDNAWVFIA